MGPASPNVGLRRRRLPSRRMSMAIVVVLIASALTCWFWPRRSWSSSEPEPMMLTAERSDFVHDLTEQGTIESGNNVEVRCEVKSVGYLGTTILEIVPEGKMVEQGEILAKLD